MRWRTTGRLLFFLYCLEFGVFLVVAPWSPSWDRAIAHLPVAWLRDLYLGAWVRGALSGLGFVHLVFAGYDLNRYLAERYGPDPARGGSRRFAPLSNGPRPPRPGGNGERPR